MTNLTKEEFMSKASTFYDKLTEELNDKTQDFYDYESKLDELMTQFSKELLEESLGEVSKNIRKKKKSKRALDK